MVVVFGAGGDIDDVDTDASDGDKSDLDAEYLTLHAYLAYFSYVRIVLFVHIVRRYVPLCTDI